MLLNLGFLIPMTENWRLMTQKLHLITGVHWKNSLRRFHSFEPVLIVNHKNALVLICFCLRSLAILKKKENADVYFFLQKNDFYIAGESYGGIYVPTLAEAVHSGQKNFNINLKVSFQCYTLINRVRKSRGVLL